MGHAFAPGVRRWLTSHSYTKMASLGFRASPMAHPPSGSVRRTTLDSAGSWRIDVKIKPRETEMERRVMPEVMRYGIARIHLKLASSLAIVSFQAVYCHVYSDHQLQY